MKVLGLTIFFLMLTLIAFEAWPSRVQVGQPSPEIHDYRYSEPFLGSKVGNMVSRACGNCHSNQTTLPWYGHIAPVSWWIERHVRQGREAMNFSDWARYPAHLRRDDLDQSVELSRTGECHPRRTPLYIPKPD